MKGCGCKDALTHLAEWVEGQLPPATHGDLQAHISGCGVCQAMVESYRKTVALCQKALRKDMPSQMLDRLLSALRDKTSPAKK
jgi:hypothetical protein